LLIHVALTVVERLSQFVKYESFTLVNEIWAAAGAAMQAAPAKKANTFVRMLVSPLLGQQGNSLWARERVYQGSRWDSSKVASLAMDQARIAARLEIIGHTPKHTPKWVAEIVLALTP
jgi:hypothetical protein